MNDKDKLEIIKRYNTRLSKYGNSDESLGWTRDNNHIRMEALVKEWKNELEDSSVLDFGCGFGDLFDYLNKSNINNVNYLGVDINESLIEVAKKKYPTANFSIKNILEDKSENIYDFAFSSGVFNHKLSHTDEYEFIFNCISSLYSKVNKGVAINFLSDKVEYDTNHNFNSNPGKILEYCYGLTNNVIIRNDYMPFEFTVYLRKDKIIERESLTFK